MITKPTSRFYYRDMMVDLLQQWRNGHVPKTYNPTLARLFRKVCKRAGYDYFIPSWFLFAYGVSVYSDLMHLAECLDERRFTPMP